MKKRGLKHQDSEPLKNITLTRANTQDFSSFGKKLGKDENLEDVGKGSSSGSGGETEVRLKCTGTGSGRFWRGI